MDQLNIDKNTENDTAKQEKNHSIRGKYSEYFLKEGKNLLQSGGKYEGTTINGKRHGVGKYFDSKGIGKYAISKNNKVVEWLRSFGDRSFNFDEFKFGDESMLKQSDEESFEWYMSQCLKGNINDELLKRIIVKLQQIDESINFEEILVKYQSKVFSDQSGIYQLILKVNKIRSVFGKKN